MTILDTTVLIDSFTGARRSAPVLRLAVDRGELLLVPALVLYEWLRGPRLRQELADQETLFPANQALSFGPTEAAVAARIYRTVGRARGREMNLAIAAHALAREADLWTLNPSDFRDIPSLRLARF